MKRIRLRTVFIYMLAVLAGTLLLKTSQSVQKAEEKLAAITQGVQTEEESLRVLKTEWAYLNNPERLETLATQYLKLEPSDPALIKTDAAGLPAKIELPEETEIHFQPVSYSPPAPAAIPQPSSKPFPPSLIKSPDSQKDFNALLNQTAKGEIE